VLNQLVDHIIFKYYNIKLKDAKQRGESMVKARVAFPLVVGLLAIILTACGSKEEETAYSFDVKDIQGNQVSLSNEKPTLIYFMAAWCPTCVAEEKVFKKVHELYRNDVQLITVDVDPSADTRESLAAFQRKYGGKWPHVLDKGLGIAKGYNVKRLEEVALVNKDQQEVYRTVNPSLDDLKEALAEIGVKR
jgi:cytochrome oxidase Cu insertion factor (SCO1/SenC/PrrC family)